MMLPWKFKQKEDTEESVFVRKKEGRIMQLNGINFKEKFSLFNEYWSPKCIARFDDYLVKVAKIKGHFTWHTHPECDEIFIVHKGKMRIDFKGRAVELNEGEMSVVQKGMEHKPFSEDGCEIILLERSDVINTGDQKNEFTKAEIEWI